MAKAAFFPQISLTGFFGVESVALSDLFTGPSRIWQFGPTVTLPIFNAGRNRANLQLTEARQREALIRYEQAIQQAFREVEDALVAHRKAREGLAEQEAAVRASREALGIAELRYTSGLTSYLNVLDAQRTLLTAEVAQSRTLLVAARGRGPALQGPRRRLEHRRRPGPGPVSPMLDLVFLLILITVLLHVFAWLTSD